MLAVFKIVGKRFIAVAAVALSAASLAGVAAAQATHPAKETSQAVVFHFGVAPAEIVQAHPSEHPERAMHGGAAKGQKHIVLALFDAATEERISEAEVQATVTPLGGSGVTKRLQPMRIADKLSFGAFFPMLSQGIYRIRFEVKRRGRPAAVANFEYRMPG